MISLVKLKMLAPLQKLPKNGRFGQNNCCQRLWKFFQSPINRPIWSHWLYHIGLMGIKKTLRAFLLKKLQLRLSSFLRKKGRSVTRFGEILPLWHNFKSIGQIFEALYSIGQILILLVQGFYWCRCTNNLAIWSHWKWR